MFQTSPSPVLQLFNVVKLMREAPDLLARITVGIPKPKKNLLYAKLAKRRLKLKKNFEEDLKTDDPKEALDIFLSNIGHHISHFIAAESVASSKT